LYFYCEFSTPKLELLELPYVKILVIEHETRKSMCFFRKSTLKKLNLIVTFCDKDQYNTTDLDLNNSEVTVEFNKCIGVSNKYKKGLMTEMSWTFKEFENGLSGGWWESSDIDDFPGMWWKSSEKQKPSGFTYQMKEILSIFDQEKEYYIYKKDD